MDSFLQAGVVIFICVSTLWLISVYLENVSIIDMFWGLGFVVISIIYVLRLEELNTRNFVVLALVSLWGLRLTLHLSLRNIGKGEDFRYSEFRRKYGTKRYWWFSYFQTFLLQGVLMMLVSLPLLGAHTGKQFSSLNALDYLAIFIWIIGFAFEAGGDFQLARFKKNPSNKGKVLRSGFWKYTRHPNYFGDSVVWFAFAMFSMAAGNYWHSIGSVIMIYLLVKISGVALLEKTLKTSKPEYKDYIKSTSSFFPWFPATKKP